MSSVWDPSFTDSSPKSPVACSLNDRSGTAGSNGEQASQDSQACTLAAAMLRLGLPSRGAKEPVELHVLGADEKELPTLDIPAFCDKWCALFRRVSLSHTALRFVFLGPNMPAVRNGHKSSFQWTEQAQMLQVTLEVRCLLYHEYLAEAGRVPLLAIAFNAGLWGYDAWLPSLEALFRGWQAGDSAPGYLVITSYTLQESEDDYDTMDTMQRSCFDGLQAGGNRKGPVGSLRWLWDCEANPHQSPLTVERRSLPQAGADADRTYRENHFWQCVSLSPAPAVCERASVCC